MIPKKLGKKFWAFFSLAGFTMKIAVIGGGTGGLVTAMVMCSRSPENLKIDLIHDPNSPIIGVGESLSHDFVQLLRGALQFQFPFDMKEVNATIKHGVALVDWCESQNFPESSTDICLCLVKEYTLTHILGDHLYCQDSNIIGDTSLKKFMVL